MNAAKLGRIRAFYLREGTNTAQQGIGDKTLRTRISSISCNPSKGVDAAFWEETYPTIWRADNTAKPEGQIPCITEGTHQYCSWMGVHITRRPRGEQILCDL